nr:phosphatase PAP2 family protein [Pedobacter sp. ASV2]
MKKNNMQGEIELKADFFKMKDVYLTASISVGYILLSVLLVGFKIDQLVLVFIFNSLYYLSRGTRKFIIGFSIFIVYWILYDYMKAFPNYLFSDVHIQSLYELEKKLFGIHFHQMLLTPNEYWKLNSIAALDVVTGFFYLMWVPVPLAFATYLFFYNRQQFVYFALTFVWVNLLGFVVYYAFPAAPPWYVQEHGFNFIAKTPGNTAGLVRFDHYFNINLFQGIYSKGSNVFAAMPSLHSSYPVIVLYYGLKNKLGAINVFFLTVMVGIWFSAVYTSHHYILDVLAGITCATIGITTFNWLIKQKPVKQFCNILIKSIT